ncbi:MAG TPA: hypothetical protein VHZ09_01720 [Acidobacteriaceae bacterium]|jgi:hypothetical protein|nr:hypothetical protein [Acidobacteriaceae bacterium]
MPLTRALLRTAKIAQGISLFGLILAGFGLIGWILSLFNRPSFFLLNLGILALPIVFIGILLLLFVAIFQYFLARPS